MNLREFIERRKQGLDIEPVEEKPLDIPVAQASVNVIPPKEDTEPHKKGNLTRAKLLAKLAGIEFKSRELVDDWLLVTYDLPATEAGDEARSKFLKLAPRIGAVMHTKSVYLMPNTNECQTASVELSKVGNVFVWTSKPIDAQATKDLTDLYDNRIKDSIKEVRARMKQIHKHMKAEKNGMANRMVDKTIEIFNNSLFSAVQRGNSALYEELVSMHKDLQELQSEVEGLV